MTTAIAPALNSKLAEALAARRFVITAECVPPRGADASATKKIAAALPKSITAAGVAENHNEIRSSALACALVLKAEGIEPVLPLVTRDRNRIALQSDALGAASLGLCNVLCVSGDHQSLGVAPQAAAAYDLDPIQLLQLLKGLRDDGTLLGGEKIAPPPALFLGGLAHPYLRPMKFATLETAKKVSAGAQFLLTQPLWDIAVFSEWLAAIRDAGLLEKVALIASVKPLTSVAGAEALQDRHQDSPFCEEIVKRMHKAADPVKEGLALSAELAAKAKALPGVRGIHILANGREDAAASIIEQAGLTRA